MNRIKFTKNHNGKLCMDIFTTIRKYTDDKMAYYVEQSGRDFQVQVGNIVKEHKVELLYVESCLFNSVSMGLIMMDTGLPRIEAIKLFGDFDIHYETRIIILTFRRIKE